MKTKPAGFCYIDHATGEHDHMNAHIRTAQCDQKPTPEAQAEPPKRGRGKWGPSPRCAAGDHGWCHNRTPEESHCGCNCHVKAQAAPPALKRYDLITNYRCGSSIEEMEPSDDGEWVRYEHIAERITALEAEHATDLVQLVREVNAQRHRADKAEGLNIALQLLIDEQMRARSQWYDAALQAEARAKVLKEALIIIRDGWHTDEIYRIVTNALQAVGEEA